MDAYLRDRDLIERIIADPSEPISKRISAVCRFLEYSLSSAMRFDAIMMLNCFMAEEQQP